MKKTAKEEFSGIFPRPLKTCKKKLCDIKKFSVPTVIIPLLGKPFAPRGTFMRLPGAAQARHAR
ncbi:MAG TPA: hypothetical protein VJ698_04670 [Noviherbaspirillum sp.]|uniref:hypothetical protein n=1 Tax=Noviherbaspirillum sp. TaxID=1926288 RepID=UPI002B48AF04|nr:hypothetical protein [Noviherbaspirillum sp.]HJV84747.1 hypothetical protein [Noviherbaspirillum sp.]